MTLKRDRWASRTFFIFAAIGSSVGLGNIWRFPFLVGKYGGGAFLIPYLLLMVVFGIPLLILEFAIGQKMQRGPVEALERIHPKFSGIGLSSILCSFVVSCYYAVVMAWSFLYCFYSLNLSWGEDTKSFFYQEVLKLSSSPSIMGSISTPIVMALIAVWIMVYFCIWKGIKSVSNIVVITMPLPIFLLFVLLGRISLLPGAYEGLVYFFTPQYDALLDFDLWMAAVSQIFFSLTLGFGVMIAYGSYRHKTSDIIKSAVITSLTDAGIAILSGLVVFATLGYMAEMSGESIADLAASGPSLAFIVFPQALSLIPWAPFFAVLFFLTLLTLGIDSLFSLVEAIAVTCSDRWPKVRKQDVVLYVCTGCFIGGITFTTAGGLYYLDITDHFITTYGLVTVTLLEVLVIGWYYGPNKMRIWANGVSDISIGPWWEGSVKYLAPLCLTILLCSQLYRDATTHYEGYALWALVLWGWTTVGLTLGLGIGLSFKKRNGV